MTDQSLTDTTDTPGAGESGSVVGLPGLADAAVETILTFEEVMTSARLVERTARICLRGDLQEKYDRLLDDLGNLVNVDGEILTEGDAALADQQRATELEEQVRALRQQMDASMRVVRFRAMPEDEWDQFEKTHKNPKGEPKDTRDYVNRLISRCAVEPTLSLEQVKQLRGKLSASQIADMAGKAFAANTAGGLDIPKLPSFLHAPKPPESATS